MSQYLNEPELFLDTKVSQHGPHMVMTNVHKPNKIKYINVDTRFRDEYSLNTMANYNITLPARITDVKTMAITNIELPLSIYNISLARGNNSFKITHIIDGSFSLLTIPDGQYDITNLLLTINSQISNMSSIFNNLHFAVNPSNNYLLCIYSTGREYSIEFAIGDGGAFDKYQFKSKLGWLMGFRKLSYTIKSANSINNPIFAEQMYDLTGSRYLYLAIDEFSKGNQHSFISPLSTSFINKNIIARISVDTTRAFGSILPNVNRRTGLLVSDTRSFTGKIDIQKLNVQLLDENGNPVSLNGLDFSFCIEVVHE